jgi:hypothetical protein
MHRTSDGARRRVMAATMCRAAPVSALIDLTCSHSQCAACDAPVLERNVARRSGRASPPTRRRYHRDSVACGEVGSPPRDRLPGVNRKIATAIARTNKARRPNAELRMPVQRVAGAKRYPPSAFASPATPTPADKRARAHRSQRSLPAPRVRHSRGSRGCIDERPRHAESDHWRAAAGTCLLN